MDYLNFDLLIERSGSRYRRIVMNSPAGEAAADFRLPFSELELENFYLHVGRPRRSVSKGDSLEIEAAKVLGGNLFKAIFNGEVLDSFRSSFDHSKQRGSGLRLRLRMTNAPELANLPWEYLYDPYNNRFLSLSVETPIVRYLEFPEIIRPLLFKPPLKVLVMISSPYNYPLLQVDQEWKQLKDTLGDLLVRRLMVLDRLEMANLAALQRHLRQGEYHIFHFIGHGGFDQNAQDGVLILEDEEAKAYPVSGKYLGALLHDHSSLRLAFLNTCEGARSSETNPFAGMAESLIQHGIPAVIAMQFELTDFAASTLAHHFYEALVSGFSVDAALSEARKAIFAQGSNIEWGTPILYMRSTDGYIFDIKEKTWFLHRKKLKGTKIFGLGAFVLHFISSIIAKIRGTSHTLVAQDEQIEKDALRLEDCTDMEAISHIHLSLSVGDQADFISALLRSFSRISQDVDAALRQESTYNRRLALRNVEDRLDSLLLELSRSNKSYALRFRPVADLWRQIVIDHVSKLAEDVELRQEIDNPYVTGVPLTTEQEIFVGRTDVSSRIEQLLLDRRRPPLVLYGQRRTGKTSLLNNLGRLLPSTIVPFFVDLQGPASMAGNYASFLYNITRGMISSAQRHRNLNLFPITRDALGSDPFTRFDEWLDDVERILGQKTALLTFDEFEALDSAITKGRFDEELVLGMLRHIIQHRPRFKVLVAGSHTLEEFQRWASYLINVQVVHLSYLKNDEVRQLIERPVKDFVLRYEPEASQRVIDLTRGHPFLVQLVCSEIVALKNEQDISVRRLARLPDVETAVPEALSHGAFFFADIERNQVDATGLAMLRFMAAQGENATVPKNVLAQSFSEKLDSALLLLNRRELIEPLDKGYRFQVELIRRWFAQENK